MNVEHQLMVLIAIGGFCTGLCVGIVWKIGKNNEDKRKEDNKYERAED